MLRKAIIAVGICASLLMLCFAVYDYHEARPIAEENLRGLALSITAAVENLAVHDPSLAALAGFHPADMAYLALIDRRGTYRFHSNPDLIGRPADEALLPTGARQVSPSEARVTLGTGEKAFQFTTPVYLPGDMLVLRLTLHTYRADAVVRRAKLNMTILLGLLLSGWMLAAALIRFARREELHQMEMARKESLAKLGEMGAMLAHEIRNPLSGIKGFAQVIAKTPVEPRNGQFAQHIVTEALRLENLVSELLAYAAADHLVPAPFDVSLLLEQTVSLLAPEASELKVLVSSACQEGLRMEGSRDRIEQALLNLGKNALHAMADGGTLRLSAVVAGNDVVITIEDSGHGIAEEHLPKIFEPFFTTKARGTGLGLAVCKKIVEEHGGAIGVISKVEKGTKITITLPLSR